MPRRRKRKEKYPILSSWSDLIHFILGLFSGIFPLFGIIASIIFYIYQNLEKESEIATIKDVENFIFGFVLGICIFLTLKIYNYVP